MHTADSTPTEVAASKLAAAITVAEQALTHVQADELDDALERIDKAGTKLAGAALALEGEGPRFWRSTLARFTR